MANDGYPKSGTKAKISKVQVTVFHAPPPSPDRPAAGIVQPDYAPQAHPNYHGQGKGNAAMPKGGGPGVKPWMGVTADQPQETM